MGVFIGVAKIWLTNKLILIYINGKSNATQKKKKKEKKWKRSVPILRRGVGNESGRHKHKHPEINL